MPQQTKSETTSKLAEARALVMEERRTRALACWNEVQSVLERHRCVIDAVPKFAESPAGYTIVTEIRVSAQDD